MKSPQQKSRLRRRNPVRINALMMARVMRMLVDGGHTVYEIAGETGLSYNTTCRYINALRREKLIRVDSWVRSGNQHVATYAMGDEPDAKKKLKPPSESTAEWKARQRMKKMFQLMAGELHDKRAET